MKKIFYSIFAVSTMLTVASCSQDEEPVSGSNGNEEVVTFTVNAGMVTRAAGDGNTVNKVHYEVWDKNTGNLVISTIPTSGAMTQARAEGVSGGRASVSMSLVKGVPYDITFWAQNEEGTAYDITAGLDDIKLKSALKANMEVYDAFFKTVEDFKVKNGSTTVELKRPFAQVNIGTAPTDWQRAIDLGVQIDKSTVTVSGVHNQFNARTAQAAGKASVTFDYNALLNETFEVKDSTYQYLAMNYLLADVEKSLHNLDVTFKDGDQIINSISIDNMPIQRNWRTNIVGRLLTSDEDFVIIVDPEFEGNHNIAEVIVNSDEELEAALRQDIDGDLIVNLGKSAQTRAVEESSKVYNVNISAWVEEYYFGGAKTNSITINANGNTINFVHNNTDWNYIRCVNEGCKWYINDAHLTNSGNNEGPWNRHDIRFYNNVELNNVTSDKAIALLNDAKLNNVKIAENGDVYALWITSEGQTVDIDGLTIDCVGRGIAIKDQYVDASAKVTLNVKNAKFNTAKKAAVLVTSTAGAEINWGAGNDINGVAADQTNAVWVDSERAAYYDLATVSGCTMVLESLGSSTVSAADADELQNLFAHPEAEEITISAPIDNGTDVFTIDRDVTLEMNGKEIKAGGQGTNNYAFNLTGNEVVVNDANLNGAGFALLEGASLEVNDSKIAAKPGKSGRNMFYVTGGSTVTVNEGTYTFDRTSCYFVYVDENSTCYINGGHFEKPLANNASKDSFVNNASTGKVIITGGTFNVDPTKWLAEGYKATKSGKIWTVSAE